MELSRLEQDCTCSLFIHANVFAGVNDVNRQTLAVQILIEQRAYTLLRAHQIHLHGQGTAGEDGAPNLRLRRLVGAHGIESNVGQHRC